MKGDETKHHQQLVDKKEDNQNLYNENLGLSEQVKGIESRYKFQIQQITDAYEEKLENERKKKAAISKGEPVSTLTPLIGKTKEQLIKERVARTPVDPMSLEGINEKIKRNKELADSLKKVLEVESYSPEIDSTNQTRDVYENALNFDVQPYTQDILQQFGAPDSILQQFLSSATQQTK